MKLSTFNTLKKLMAMTTSENDPESLQAIRGANRILKENDLTWDKVFAKTVTVVNEFEAAPEDDTRDGMKIRERDRIEEAFRAVEQSDPRGGFADFVQSLKDRWETQGSLSPAQKDSLFKAADRTRK